MIDKIKILAFLCIISSSILNAQESQQDVYIEDMHVDIIKQVPEAAQENNTTEQKAKVSKELNVTQPIVINMNLEEFATRIEKNSINLVELGAMRNSIYYDGKSARAWESGSIEATNSSQKSNGVKTNETEILMMFSPRLPWVRSAINTNYKTKVLKAEQTYNLNKNLALIMAKKMYLDYLIIKEQFEVYATRQQNAHTQLEISKSQLDAGRISKAQYLFFQSDFLATSLALERSSTELKNAKTFIAIALGITDEIQDIIVKDLEFSYIRVDDIITQDIIKNSPYLSILDLDVLDYTQSAKLALHSSIDALGVGVGSTLSQSNSTNNNSLNLKVVIPFPFTSKHYHKRNSFLALRNGALDKKSILSNSLATNIESLKEQLRQKQSYIALARQDENNKKRLSEIIKIGYESGKISAFEYLSVRNNYLNAIIATILAKKDYVATLAMLEESIGQESIITQSKTNQGE